MKKLVIFKGLPGSGKSTLAAKMAVDGGLWFRINRDDLRAMAVGPGNNPTQNDKTFEKLIREAKAKLILHAWDSGFDVIVDDTHLVKQVVRSLHKLAEKYGDVEVTEIGVDVDIETCLARNALRQGFARVPDKVIRDMAKASGLDRGFKTALENRVTYYPPKQPCATPITQDPKLPKAIICDLDGTLAIIGDRSPYDATDCDLKDSLNVPVRNTLWGVELAFGHDIIFMSARDSKYRPDTERFIIKHLQNEPGTYDLRYQLYMRAEGDTRKDWIVKKELFETHVKGKYYVDFVLDDRDQVVKLWREMGLTCFQVAPGDF